MKKLSLLFMSLLAAVGVSAQGSADFDTMNTDSNTSYKERTSTAGWVAKNSAMVDVSGYDHKAPTLNGKTSAVGTLTSPALSGGIGTLTFKYAYTYGESKGVSLRIDIMQDGKAAKTETLTVANSDMTKGEVYTYTSPELNVAGDFSIVITNLCPSNSTSNKDRLSIPELSWTGYTDNGGGDDPTPAEEHYVLLKNTDNWATPYVWAWNGDVNCTASGVWAGDKMTLVEGETDLYRWDLPAGKPVPAQLLISDNGSDDYRFETAYVDQQTYNCDGNKYDPNAEVVEYTFYFDNSATNWENVYVYNYGNGYPSIGAWSDTQVTAKDETTGYYKFVTTKNIVGSNIMWHNGAGQETGNSVLAVDKGVYKFTGNKSNDGVYVGLYGEDPIPDDPDRTYGPETLLAIYTPWFNETTEMTKDGSTFTAKGVKIAGEGYLQFCTNTDVTGWKSDFGTRYAASNAAAQTLTFTDGVATAALSAGSDMAFNTGTGTFDITVTFTSDNAATMTLTKSEVVEPLPDPEEQDPDTEYYVLLKNTAGWATPTVWAWAVTGENNCTASGVWAGDEMTLVEGETDLYRWNLPAGKYVPTDIIISDAGDDNDRFEKAYVNQQTYDCTGAKYEGGDNPTPDPVVAPEGVIAIASTWWAEESTKVMDNEGDGIFTVSGLLVSADSGATKADYGFVQFGSNTGATDWDSINNGDRYGAAEENTEVELTDGEGTADLTVFPVNVSAAGCNAFMIPSGYYDITILFDESGIMAEFVRTEDAPVVVVAAPEAFVLHHNGLVETGWHHVGHNMTKADNVFTLESVNLPGHVNDDAAYFHFSDTPDAESWDALNARYGATTDGEELQFVDNKAEAPLVLASGEPKAFKVTPGNYNMTVEFDNNGKGTLRMEQKSTSLTGIAADGAADVKVEYFNLQGMKVENPANGIYIRRAGSEVSKVAL